MHSRNARSTSAFEYTFEPGFWTSQFMAFDRIWLQDFSWASAGAGETVSPNSSACPHASTRRFCMNRHSPNKPFDSSTKIPQVALRQVDASPPSWLRQRILGRAGSPLPKQRASAVVPVPAARVAILALMAYLEDVMLRCMRAWKSEPIRAGDATNTHIRSSYSRCRG